MSHLHLKKFPSIHRWPQLRARSNLLPGIRIWPITLSFLLGQQIYRNCRYGDTITIVEVELIKRSKTLSMYCEFRYCRDFSESVILMYVTYVIGK